MSFLIVSRTGHGRASAVSSSSVGARLMGLMKDADPGILSYIKVQFQ